VNNSVEMSFWDHLDVLRGVLFRSAFMLIVLSLILFCFKSFLFDNIVLAPTKSDFYLYKWLGVPFDMPIINIDISAQFFIHLKVAVAFGFILAFPYIIFEIWKFIAPALYENEKKTVKAAFSMASVLFYMGLAVGYFFVIPVCLNFFIHYSISSDVVNRISLNSYISLFMSMVLLTGILFEFPSIIAILSRFGIVTRKMLRNFRKYAFCLILVVAAAVTPTDPFSMFVLALPLYGLYEMSILICKKEI
jgi:sec-independent protein translocase protein TatC